MAGLAESFQLAHASIEVFVGLTEEGLEIADSLGDLLVLLVHHLGDIGDTFGDETNVVPKILDGNMGSPDIGL